MQDVWTCTTLGWVNLNRYSWNSDSCNTSTTRPSTGIASLWLLPSENFFNSSLPFPRLIKSRWTTPMASYRVGKWRVATSDPLCPAWGGAFVMVGKLVGKVEEDKTSSKAPAFLSLLIRITASFATYLLTRWRLADMSNPGAPTMNELDVMHCRR